MSVELKLAALELAQRAKLAARELLRRDRRQLVLDAAAEIEKRAGDILAANEVDLAKAKGENPAFLDRLRLDRKRLRAIAQALDEVAGLPDPVEISTLDGTPFARGLAVYSADEVRRIVGRRSAEIEAALGYRLLDCVVHRDDLVVMQ